MSKLLLSSQLWWVIIAIVISVVCAQTNMTHNAFCGQFKKCDDCVPAVSGNFTCGWCFSNSTCLPSNSTICGKKDFASNGTCKISDFTVLITLLVLFLVGGPLVCEYRLCTHSR
ncbi:hypothetical protein BKA69DRAFT_1090575 [Paraphysoderma sedebokerense]|nr:hypothetical protein BKA69DRAFT_1090575 [Paraphysoderma sedebokerense]